MVAYELDDSGWTLTTDPPAALGGEPALIHAGRTYEPSDLAGGPANRVAAWAFVQLRTTPGESTRHKAVLARAFLQRWPDGPQIDPWLCDSGGPITAPSEMSL